MIASELRVGNLVSSESGEIFDITPTNIRLLHHNDKTPIYPIPLTPEILEKCGFVFDGDFNYQNGKLILHDMTDTEIKCFEVYWQYPKDIMVVANFLTVKYVHKLQNLYYELMGEELEISL